MTDIEQVREELRQALRHVDALIPRHHINRALAALDRMESSIDAATLEKAAKVAADVAWDNGQGWLAQILEKRIRLIPPPAKKERRQSCRAAEEEKP
jgi:hypothetical protein